MAKDNRSSNDQRSDAHNPNSSEHKAASDNRSNQMNPNNPSYHSSRGEKPMNDYDDDDDDDDWCEPDNRCVVCKKETNINADGVCSKCAPIFYADMDVNYVD